MTRLLRLAAAAGALALVVAACSSGDGGAAAGPSSTAAASPTSAAPATSAAGGGTSAAAAITIQGFRFGGPLTVAPGATVTVTNLDSAGHNVVSDDQGKFSTPTLQQGDKATFTAPTQPGTYKFSCTLHASMSGTGTLIVSG